MRVLFVAGVDEVLSGGAGGQATEARMILAGLQARHAVEVISSTMRSIPPPGMLLRGSAAACRLLRVLRSLHASDVLFIYVPGSLGILEKGAACVAACAMGKPVVARFGSGRIPALSASYATYRAWLRIVLRSADVISVQGEVWRNFFESFDEAAGKVVVVPNGIDSSEVRPRKPVEGLVGLVGWLHREKGIFDALEICNRLSREFPFLRLLVIGRGHHEAQFREEVERRGLERMVVLRGWLNRAEVFDELSRMKALLFPSYVEGMPNAVLEAMVAGVPVIASRVGAVGEVIEHGRTGFICEPGNVEQFSRYLRRVFLEQDLATSMGSAAREAVLEKCDKERVFDRHDDSIWRAVGNRRDD